MDALRDYLNSLEPAEQMAYAKRCGTTIGYLRKALSTKPRIDTSLVIELERESAGAVSCESLRPDVDWSYLKQRRINGRKH
jgi:DNA-binding transcriptional regulator YdaS (Cro superfamily)